MIFATTLLENAKQGEKTKIPDDNNKENEKSSKGIFQIALI